jgi:hypothetical protein
LKLIIPYIKHKSKNFREMIFILFVPMPPDETFRRKKRINELNFRRRSLKKVSLKIF